jgi:hypothetical protein
MDNKRTLDNLRLAINNRLDNCNSRTMPMVCKMAQTKEGREVIIQFVINLVAQGEFEIINALMEKERSLNPNMIQD